LDNGQVKKWNPNTKRPRRRPRRRWKDRVVKDLKELGIENEEELAKETGGGKWLVRQWV